MKANLATAGRVRLTVGAVLLGLAIIAAGAAAMGTAAGCEENKPKTAKVTLPPANVTHVVVCWLKQPDDPAAREKLIEASKSFCGIPGVVNVDVGTPIASTRPVVDSTYDVAVVIRFKDVASMRAYEDHPKHQQAVHEVLGPLARKIIIYDFQDK